MIIAVFLGLVLGIAPAVMLRWVLVRKPLSKGISIGVSAVIWFAGLFLFLALGAKNSMAGFSAAVAAYCSYLILRGAGNSAEPPKQS